MEIKIGEIFEVDGTRVICEEAKTYDCRECFFKEKNCYKYECSFLSRKDRKIVIFKELKN